MFACDVKQYLGRNVAVAYRDRRGDAHIRSLHVHGVAFAPGRGCCLVGDSDDVWLDEVTSVSTVE